MRIAPVPTRAPPGALAGRAATVSKRTVRASGSGASGAGAGAPAPADARCASSDAHGSAALMSAIV